MESNTEIAVNPFSAGAGVVATTEVGALAAVAREQTEIQSAIVIAKKFKRNEADCYTRALASFERPAMAEAAAYEFPRGGQKVTGPSVDCARELARCWGNIRYGLKIVSMDEDYIAIAGWAWDLESNTYVEAHDKFRRLIQRKDKATGITKWVEPDERDARELQNRRGAICVRNALLQLLPPDVVDEVLRRAQETMRKAAAGELQQSREDAIRRLVLSFSRLGVNAEMIERHLGHEIGLINADEMAKLRAIGKSIADGQSKREDHFTLKAEEPPPSLADQIRQKKSEAK